MSKVVEPTLQYVHTALLESTPALSTLQEGESHSASHEPCKGINSLEYIVRVKIHFLVRPYIGYVRNIVHQHNCRMIDVLSQSIPPFPNQSKWLHMTNSACMQEMCALVLGAKP